MQRGGTNTSGPGPRSFCYFCGRWPAALYKNLEEKHSHRVCEVCVADGVVIKVDGVYVTNPERLAEPAESPDSDSRSSSSRSGAPGSAA